MMSSKPRRRPAPRPVRSPADLYITRKTNFKAQLEKCRETLTSGQDEIILHALGAAVSRCINLALQLQASLHNTCNIEVNTSTVDLIDDFEPTSDDGEYKSQVRQNSAIHIRVYKIALVGAN